MKPFAKLIAIKMLAAGVGTALIFSLGVSPVLAQDSAGPAVYDEGAYTEHVEKTMKKLDQLFIDFSNARGVDAVAAAKAEKEFLTGVHELMQYMNGKFDSLDPKMGAALSPTETLVSIHAQTMLIDILASNQLQHLQAHAYIE